MKNFITNVSKWFYKKISDNIVGFTSAGGASFGVIISTILSLLGLLILLLVVCLGVLIIVNGLGCGIILILNVIVGLIALIITAIAAILVGIVMGIYIFPVIATYHVSFLLVDKEPGLLIYAIVVVLWTGILISFFIRVSEELKKEKQAVTSENKE